MKLDGWEQVGDTRWVHRRELVTMVFIERRRHRVEFYLYFENLKLKMSFWAPHFISVDHVLRVEEHTILTVAWFEFVSQEDSDFRQWMSKTLTHQQIISYWNDETKHHRTMEKYYKMKYSGNMV
jgi:hypothetical protein